ncbi:MAG: hypothetical protein PHV30_07540 [Candidatus Margulisbacteria bacterium]|nr:hypothetical protein [Candidatus Margulisiibacteriota bacterium]
MGDTNVSGWSHGISSGNDGKVTGDKGDLKFSSQVIEDEGDVEITYHGVKIEGQQLNVDYEGEYHSNITGKDYDCDYEESYIRLSKDVTIDGTALKAGDMITWRDTDLDGSQDANEFGILKQSQNWLCIGERFYSDKFNFFNSSNNQNNNMSLYSYEVNNYLNSLGTHDKNVSTDFATTTTQSWGGEGDWTTTTTNTHAGDVLAGLKDPDESNFSATTSGSGTTGTVTYPNGTSSTPSVYTDPGTGITYPNQETTTSGYSLTDAQINEIKRSVNNGVSVAKIIESLTSSVSTDGSSSNLTQAQIDAKKAAMTQAIKDYLNKHYNLNLK